jgi:hypothetical protein
MLQSREHEKNKQTTNNNNQPQRGLQINHPRLIVKHDKNKQLTTTISPAVGNLTRSNNKQQQSTPSWGHGFPLCNQSFEPVDERRVAPHHLHTLCLMLRLQNVMCSTTMAHVWLIVEHVTKPRS